MGTCDICGGLEKSGQIGVFSFDDVVLACCSDAINLARVHGSHRVIVAHFIYAMCSVHRAKLTLARRGADPETIRSELASLIIGDTRANHNRMPVPGDELNELLLIARQISEQSGSHVVTIDSILIALAQFGQDDPAVQTLRRSFAAASSASRNGYDWRSADRSQRSTLSVTTHMNPGSRESVSSRYDEGARDRRPDAGYATNNRAASSPTAPMTVYASKPMRDRENGRGDGNSLHTATGRVWNDGHSARLANEPTSSRYHRAESTTATRHQGQVSFQAYQHSDDDAQNRHRPANYTAQTSSVANNGKVEKSDFTGLYSRLDDIAGLLKVHSQRLEQLEQQVGRSQTQSRQTIASSSAGSDSRTRSSSTGGSRCATSNSARSESRSTTGTSDRSSKRTRQSTNWERAKRSERSERDSRQSRSSKWTRRRKKSSRYLRDIARQRRSARRAQSRARVRNERTRNRAEMREVESPRSPRFYLSLSDDIVEAPSIGPKTAARLTPVGVHTVRDLLEADPQTSVERIDTRHITVEVFSDWQDQARLVCTVPWLRATHAQLLVGAGFRSAEQIADADLGAVLAGILRFATTSKGERVLRSGDPPEEEKVATWVENARQADLSRAAQSLTD